MFQRLIYLCFHQKYEMGLIREYTIHLSYLGHLPSFKA